MGRLFLSLIFLTALTAQAETLHFTTLPRGQLPSSQSALLVEETLELVGRDPRFDDALVFWSTTHWAENGHVESRDLREGTAHRVGHDVWELAIDTPGDEIEVQRFELTSIQSRTFVDKYYRFESIGSDRVLLYFRLAH